MLFVSLVILLMFPRSGWFTAFAWNGNNGEIGSLRTSSTKDGISNEVGTKPDAKCEHL